MSRTTNFMEWENPGTALITGASSGIGAEYARQLSAQGFNLVLVARRKHKLEELSQQLTSKYLNKVEVIGADLSNPTDNEKLITKISSIEDLDILINNAGFGLAKDFLEWEPKNFEDMITVHLTAPVIFCHAALPGMITRNRGVIINVSSLSAIMKTSPIYSSTKAAIIYFSEILQKYIRQKGIYFQSLCPGFTHTGFHSSKTMEGANMDYISDERWMNVEEVVSISLSNVKTKKHIVIPGENNLELARETRKRNSKKYLVCKII